MNHESPLKRPSPQSWTDCVLNNFDAFLLDHAAAEKKASGMALSMVSHYPDRPRLVLAMAELAVEEMVHFREVIKIVQSRGLTLGADVKDPYVNSIRSLLRQGSELYLLDRLLTAGVIEARGAERFGLIAEALPEGELKTFYRSITRSEDRHFELFLDLASEYFSSEIIESRWQEILTFESQVVTELPIRAALH
jgi:tRNA-(ms[2]io[6]A)-hydroxylase